MKKPCKGDNSLLPIGVNTDIIGLARIQGTTVDIGAYEGGTFMCPSATELYVDANVASTNEGISWATAFKTLDEALYAAWKCPTVQKIYVATGTYKPTKKPYNMGVDKKGVEIITTSTRDATFHIRSGINLQGGFPSGGGTQNITANPTILSGDIGVLSNITDNAYHVVFADSSVNWATTGSITKINGFTIRDGNSNANSNIIINGNITSTSQGSGIYSFKGVEIISNCIISSNINSAIYGANTTLTINNNQVERKKN